MGKETDVINKVEVNIFKGGLSVVGDRDWGTNEVMARFM